jgi:hypothetical protein
MPDLVNTLLACCLPRRWTLADLRVDTAQLRAAASDLRSVVEVATAAGDRSSQVAALVPELGAEQAVQAVARPRWPTKPRRPR